ncbi:MAG: ABC transporter ATP-binding protein [Candidatus Thermoplasmatota archaeon]|jgi:ABC-2 type transport system ATP-binding protein|nr:ABC transporter ATP-binding protein [Candidatus Thermoplasmatota archaeon]MDP7265651.1 ABC transporter ATP-binding protein [Candidatus Thermoplasmatota archaeon]
MMITIRDLTKRYPPGIPRWKKWFRRYKKDAFMGELAVDRLNMEVKKGQVYGFIGPNGAGKTTTIKMLVGLMPPTSGTALVCGLDVVEEGEMVRGRIGYMPEAPSFYPRVSVLDVLRYYSKLYSIPSRSIDKKILKVLRIVGIAGEKSKLCGKLSFGMKKRLSLAQALLNDPELLILDEPTGGLDPAGKRDFRKLLRKLSDSGITIFMSSHLLEEVQKISTHVGIIHHGRLITSGNLAELQEKMGKEAKVKIVVTVAPSSEIPSSSIKDMKSIIDLRISENKMTIVAENGDISSEVNRLLVENNCPVRSMVIEEPELEDIFFDHTST